MFKIHIVISTQNFIFSCEIFFLQRTRICVPIDKTLFEIHVVLLTQNFLFPASEQE